MASIPTPTTSKQSIALASPSSRMDEEDKIGYETDLSTEDIEIETNTDTSTWSTADKKKLQHMTEFHMEYQCVFRRGSLNQNYNEKKNLLYESPMPKAVFEEEMQNAQLDSNEVIIEYITDTQGNKVKKLKQIFIKSEPDREHILHVDSDDNLPAVPEENFTRKRERVIDSYSDSISLDDDPSNEGTITADSNSFVAAIFEETPCGWEADPKGIEATLHQIATSLQSAAEGYLALTSHMFWVAPYELPQIVAHIPPPPMDVPLAIRKALPIDGESKAVSHLIHGEYELTNTSWSQLQKKYHVSRDKTYTAIKGKRRPGGSQHQQKKKIKKSIKPKATISTSPQELLNK